MFVSFWENILSSSLLFAIRLLSVKDAWLFECGVLMKGLVARDVVIAVDDNDNSVDANDNTDEDENDGNVGDFNCIEDGDWTDSFPIFVCCFKIFSLNP